jgi:hypothetical protein
MSGVSWLGMRPLVKSVSVTECNITALTHFLTLAGGRLRVTHHGLPFPFLLWPNLSRAAARESVEGVSRHVQSGQVLP